MSSGTVISPGGAAVISQSVEYALRAVVCLASRQGEALTAAAIAAQAEVPAQYLPKVLRALVKGGILQARRGVGGGTALARPAEKIFVLDVVNAVEPLRRIEGCPRASSKLNLCLLHRRMDDALALIEQAFRGCAISELVPAGPAPRTCPFPNIRPRQR